MIIGRKPEQKELLDAANSEYSKFVAVYGRRRVGKTFLIRETFNYSFTFQHTGLARGKMKDQLLSFRESLKRLQERSIINSRTGTRLFLHWRNGSVLCLMAKRLYSLTNFRGWIHLAQISYQDWSTFGIAGPRQEKTYFSLLVVLQPLGL